MASLEECWAQLFDSPWARQVAGRRVVRPTPFSRDARKWARQYLEEDGTGSPMMKDRAEIKEIVAAFLRQGNIIAKHLPPFEDSRMAKKVVQMPRDRVVYDISGFVVVMTCLLMIAELRRFLWKPSPSCTSMPTRKGEVDRKH